MKNYRVFIVLIVVTIIYLTVSVNSAFVINKPDEIITAYKNNSLIRLHVIANSNSPQDQYIKRLIRNQIINKINEYKGSNIIEKEMINNLEKQVNGILERNNTGYLATVEFGNYKFPMRSYGNLTLPEGNYRAVKVVLGAGKGSNWWCVLFPPLCISSKKINRGDNNINNTDENVLSNNYTVEFKLKIRELFKNNHYKLVKLKRGLSTPEKQKVIKLFQTNSEPG